VRRRGTRVAILAFGSMVDPCRAVAERLDATLINMRFVKPLDREAILAAASGTPTNTVSAVESSACQAVNQSRRQTPGEFSAATACSASGTPKLTRRSDTNG